MRRVIAALIVAGLAIGVFLLWPRAEPDDPSDTLAIPSTTSSISDPTTTTDAGTTTSVDGTQVVETVEEAEAILRELWFGWFQGIYNQDEDRIREVVATTHQLQLATEQFGQMEFERAPLPTDLSYSNSEILHATDQCTVIHTRLTLTGFQDAETTDVYVLRWNDGWRFFSLWAFPDDLWESDCEAELN
jgi:hypothetical protein